MINKYKFFKATLDKDFETYIVYLSILENIGIHSLANLLLGVLQQNKASTGVRDKYVDYIDVFLFSLIRANERSMIANSSKLPSNQIFSYRTRILSLLVRFCKALIKNLAKKSLY